MVPARISAAGVVSVPGGVGAVISAPGLDAGIPLVQTLPHFLGVIRASLPFAPGDKGPGGGHAHDSCRPENLEPLSATRSHGVRIGLQLSLRTGKIWV